MDRILLLMILKPSVRQYASINTIQQTTPIIKPFKIRVGQECTSNLEVKNPSPVIVTATKIRLKNN